MRASHYLIMIGSLSDALFLMIGARWVGDVTFTLATMLSLALAWRSGWKHGLTLFALGSISGFIFEFIGLNFGVPFGKYEYIAFQKGRIGGVPFPIVVAWGTYVYVSYMSLRSNGWIRPVLASALLVSLDLLIDPVMVSIGLWKWISSCPCIFGIPLINYVGWFITALFATALFKVLGENPLSVRWGYFTFLSLYAPIVTVSLTSGHIFFEPLLISLAISLALMWVDSKLEP